MRGDVRAVSRHLDTLSASAERTRGPVENSTQRSPRRGAGRSTRPGTWRKLSTDWERHARLNKAGRASTPALEMKPPGLV
jgi:hypothetical protein